MAITAAISPGITVPGEGLRSITREYIELMEAACQRFLLWEREHILKKQAPATQDQEEHRQTLKWLLRLTRIVQLMAADPDFPDHSSRELIEMMIWKLDHSWRTIYEPMPEAEYERLLAEVFPNEPGA